MDNARDLERYNSIGADIRQVESVIVELERHSRVLSTHVTELRDLLETMEAVIRLVRAVARCSGTSTIAGAVPLTRGKIARASQEPEGSTEAEATRTCKYVI